MNNKDIKELLKLDKELLDYASCMQMATKYWSYVNILDTKSQTFLCCTSS